MNRHHVVGRPVSIVLLVAFALIATSAPVALAGSDATTCRVRNVTQDTQGHSFKVTVSAAHHGDRLRVRGKCRGAVIGKDLIIRGVGDDAVLTGRDRHRVLLIKPGATVTIRDLRITHGLAPSSGGGIANGGTLILVDSVVSRSESAYEYWGGGIANGGTLTLRRTSIRYNRAYWAGGILNHGTLILVDSVVHGNQTDGVWGGGIGNEGTLVVRDSIVRGNRSEGEGGGIYNSGTVTLDRTTVSGNVSRRWGGGIHNQGPGSSITLTGSTVRGNRADGTGGGISNVAGDVTMTDSELDHNEAGDAGGGIHSRGNQADVIFTRSVIRANAAQVGGGIWNFQGEVTLVDSSVTLNTSGQPGGGILHQDPGTVTLEGTSSVSGNTPDDCVGTPAC